MSNQWLRLWHDMPTDPKWRTIARVSGQSIALVQAVYLHLLVDASRNVTRGHATVTAEDLASALDVTDDQIESVMAAMQGRVIDGQAITGWDRRQPKREDAGSPETGAKSAAQRKREQRERLRGVTNVTESVTCHEESRNSVTCATGEAYEKAAVAAGKAVEATHETRTAAGLDAGVTQCHAMSRNVTTDKDKDKEESKEQKHTPLPPSAVAGGFAEFWSAYPLKKAKATAEKAWAKLKPSADLQAAILSAIAAHKLSADWQRDGGQYIPHPTTWLNQRRWEDEVTHASSTRSDSVRPLSAVDAVKQAIAEREARSAAAGQAVDQDGGTLWEEMDGEFRCVG